MFGGYFGLHRFYLGRYYSGTLYLLTFGFLGLGVVFDLICLPSLTLKSKEHLIVAQADSYTTLDAIPQLQEPAPILDQLDPFKSASPLISTLKMIIFSVWLFTIPYVSIVYFQDYIFTTIFSLIILSFISTQVVSRLASTPILHLLFNGFYIGLQRLELYYRHTVPQRLSVPILSTFLFFLSARGRTEFKLFKGLAHFGIMLIILEWISLIYEYRTSYYPELGVTSILKVKFITLIVTIMIMVSSALPVMRTLIYAKISNRQDDIKISIFIALTLLCLMIDQPHIEYSQEDYMRYEERFKASSSFRAKIDKVIQNLINQQVTRWRPDHNSHPHHSIISSHPRLSTQLNEALSSSSSSIQPQNKTTKVLNQLDQNTRRLLMFNQVGIHFHLETSRAWQSIIKKHLVRIGVLPDEASMLRVLLFSRDLSRRHNILFNILKFMPTSIDNAAELCRPISYQGDTLGTLKREQFSPLKLSPLEALEAVNHALSDDTLKRLDQGTFLLIYDGFNDDDIHRPRIYKLHQSSPQSGAPSPHQVELISWGRLNQVTRALEIKEMQKMLHYTH